MKRSLQALADFAPAHEGQQPSEPLPARWVAFSGGLDSTVLLRACVLAGWPVRAVHVNHHLQTAAAQMQAHCERQCDALGVPLDVLHVQVQCSGGQSLEAQARRARYRAIGEHLLAQTGSADLLTAHHRDDQVETVLIALFRGSGIEGLAGMSPTAPWPVALPHADRLRLLRPFLAVSRDALWQDAQAMGATWFDDPTNTDVRLRRNWLRQDGLPQLRKQFPQVDASVLRLARQIADVRAEWQVQAQALVSDSCDDQGRIRRSAFGRLTDLQQVRLLRHWLADADIRLSEARCLELRDQLLQPQGGLRRVADDWALRLRGDWIALERDSDGNASRSPSGDPDADGQGSHT